MPKDYLDLPGLGLRLERQIAPFEVRYKHAVQSTERKFKLSFDLLTVFTEDALRDLHAPFQSGLPANINLVTADKALVGASIEDLARLAGSKKTPTRKARIAYLQALKQLSAANIALMEDRFYRRDVCFIGVEREGAILAMLLGLNPPFNYSTPHLKRVKFDSSLLIGICGMPEPRKCAEVVIVDGAIASGATVMALLAHLKPARATIYSAHAAMQGLHAIARFASAVGTQLDVYSGFVTDGLSDEFYATQEGKLVVGDLGDWIAPLYPSES